uniref:ARID domain-containing protein n=1 Tax=Meloidogyne incognita TaxID=6306 RepID=A0A914LXM5_MELIC
MLARKRRNLKDEYVQFLSTPVEKRLKANQFYENLRHFYRRKWGCSLRIPYANGKELDLYELYDAVISLGGWQKVTNFDRWGEVLQKLSISENIQMAEHAVRIIYMQYLCKFEQNESGGDIVEEHENELIGIRSARLKGMIAMPSYSEPPMSVFRSSDNFPPLDFHKLVFSLLSGLPNEVVFALNVLTIMSHPGPFVLNFENCPNIIDLLVSLIGIKVDLLGAAPSNLFKWWKETSNYDFTKFWKYSGIDEGIFNCWIFSSEQENLKLSSLSEIYKDDNFDLSKPTNWRVFSILGILHNLSFEENNLLTMGENKALLRLLLICCNCRWQLLKRIACETLSNISKNINLISIEDPLTGSAFFKSIQSGLNSNDRFEILRFIEIIGGLCQTTLNEPILCDFLDKTNFFPRIFTLLTLKDILICIISLETILQLSELGRNACELISGCNKSVEQLIGMLTTDAASFGQAGLSGIKVVEINGHHVQPYVNPNKKKLHSLNQSNQHSKTTTQQQQQPIITNTTTPINNHLPPITNNNFSELDKSINNIATKTKSKNNSNKKCVEAQMPQHMCEWMMMALDDTNEEIEPCSRFFSTPSQLLFHIYEDHLKALVQSHASSAAKNPDNVCMIRCRWPMCDSTPRTLWSMTTHLQDVHCTEQSLEINLQKRNEFGLDDYINQIRQLFKQNREQGQQPGYAPFAAYEAIRRHALTNLKKDLTDDNEGPVTRNIRLTSAIILRNLSKHSTLARRKLQRFEGFLSWLSLSKLESSRTLSQCLFEIITQSPIDNNNIEQLKPTEEE